MQNNHNPHLATPLTGPLHLLEKQILSKQDEIEAWFLAQWQNTPAPVYGSVDLRNAGFKLAPVDMNLFPAGFNNLSVNFLTCSIAAAKSAILTALPHAQRILLVPENHTRNLFYWENIKNLIQTLSGAGFELRVGSLVADFQEPSEQITVQTIERKNNKLYLDGFMPDVVLLNNDLSNSIPDILRDLEQPVLPPSELGWSRRSKSEHFYHYANVCDEFAKLIAIDPWFIAPLFRPCGEIDFMKAEGEDRLVTEVGDLLTAIQKKYAEYQIDCKPYVVVKADAGTYGVAVMMVKSVDEVRSLNRKQRVSMSKSKGGKPVSRVIMQEGVYTFETWGPENAVAEPVVYMWGQRVAGGFYRVHKDRGIDENLNSPGMHFEPLAFSTSCHEPCQKSPHDDSRNRFYVYGIIARLSMLAAAREMQAVAQGAMNDN